MSQVIVTKLLPVTNTKPKRISAQTTSGIRNINSWETLSNINEEPIYLLNGIEYESIKVHYHTAKNLAKSLHWKFNTMYYGDLNMRGDMVWIFE